MNRTDFYIVQKPVAISFDCPICKGDVTIPWANVDVPAYWGDHWPYVTCPYCGEEIGLDEYEMD